ncbi:MAG: bacterioferritin [Burkholderiaceae bacterium]|jgi:bacterioferritin|nr:bacterioferritin [Burkholderiaceae bacterium]
MKIDHRVLLELNAVLRESLTAINQYFLHGRMLKNAGYHALDERVVHRSIDEMKMADKLVQRIFLLEGLPNLQELNKLLIGENVPEILACDLKLEQRKHQVLLKAIATCEKLEDFVTRDLLEKFKHENEESIDWIETQQDLIDAMGLQNYLQSQTL